MKRLWKKGLSLLLVTLLLTAMLPLSASAAGVSVTVTTVHGSDTGTPVDPGTGEGMGVELRKSRDNSGAVQLTPKSDQVGVFELPAETLLDAENYNVWVNGFKTRHTISGATGGEATVTLWKVDVVTNPSPADDCYVKLKLNPTNGSSNTTTGSELTWIYAPEHARSEGGNGPYITFQAFLSGSWTLRTKYGNRGTESWTTLNGGSGVNIASEDRSKNPTTGKFNGNGNLETSGLTADLTYQAHLVHTWTTNVEVKPDGAESKAVFQEYANDGAEFTGEQTSVETTEDSLLNVVFKPEGSETLDHWEVSTGTLYTGVSSSTGKGETSVKPTECHETSVYFEPGNNNATITAYVKTAPQPVTVNVNKDNAAWSGQTVELRPADGAAVSLTDSTSSGAYTNDEVTVGTYSIFVNGQDTGKDLEVTTGDNTAEVNYYTVDLKTIPDGLAVSHGTDVSTGTKSAVFLAGAAAQNITAAAGGSVSGANYTFRNWTVGAGFGGVTVAGANSRSTTFTLPAEDTLKGYTGFPITITANYEKVPDGTVTFDLDGGKIGEASTVEPKTGTPGDPVPTPGTPTKEGYTFQGWDSDGDGTVDYDFEDTTPTFPADSLNLKAVYTPNEYTVTFYLNDGTDTQYQQDTVEYNTQVSKPAADPTRTGYDFGGWYTDPDCTTEADFTQGITKNTDFYAKWTAKKYDVTFHMNDGTATAADPDADRYGDAAQVEYNAKASKPAADPTRTGYDFGGWYADPACTTEADFTQGITKDTDFYAKWTEAAAPTPTEFAVTVTVNVDNQPWASANPRLRLYPASGEPIELKNNGNATFTGTAPNGTYDIGIIVQGQTASSDTRQTITVAGAPASAEVNCYNVRLVMTDGAKTLTTASGGVKVNHGANVDGETMTTNTAFVVLGDARTGLPIAASENNHDGPGTDKAHYHFYGWTASHGVTVADANDPTTTFSLPDLATLKADAAITQAIPITITATFQAQDSVSFDSNAPEGVTETLTDPEDQFVDPAGGPLPYGVPGAPGTLEHYDFVGWFTEREGGEKVDKDTVLHGPDHLYAHWTAKKYPVTFYKNDGTDTVHYTKEMEYNSQVDAASAPTRSGFNFTGWGTQAGEHVDFPVTVTGPLNFYAQWEDQSAIPYSVTVTVNKDNAPWAGQTVTLHRGGVDTPMTAGADGVYTANVTNGRWSVYVGGRNTGKSLTVDNATASAEVNYYTVRVALATDKGAALTTAAANVQAGHGPDKAAEQVFLAQAAAQPGLPLTASENNHDGGPGTDGQHYHFYDWKADAATGVAVAGAESASSSFTLPAEADLTGNAAITAATPITITARFQAQDSIAFDPNAPEDGELKAPDDQFVDPAGGPLPYGVPDAPGDLPHYTFDGWYTEKVGGEKVDKDTTLHGPDHLYAHWTAKDYDVTFHKNDGSANDTDTEKVPYQTAPTKPADPTRSGYTFGGWYTDPACTTEADFTKGIEGNTDFYAKWTANRGGVSSGSGGSRGVKVTYLLGLYGSTQDSTTETLSYNAKPKAVPSVTAQDAYQFLGWSRTGPTGDLAADAARTLVDPTTVSVTSDTTFYAVYQQTHALPDQPYHTHYVIGYPDGTFGPGDNIDRASVATIIARAVLPDFQEGSDYGNPGNYSDVNGHWAASAIAYCSKYGVFNGYADGTFRPTQSISRQELALVIARLDGVLTGGAVPFSDGDQIGDWAKDGVYTAYTKGWVSGYPDGTFKPLNPIRRDEAVKIFNAFLGRGVDAAGLSGLTEYVHTGAAGNITENGSTEYMTWSDVPQGQWAYYEIIEAANDHTCDTSKTSLPETWLRCWIDEHWNYHNS